MNTSEACVELLEALGFVTTDRLVHVFMRRGLRALLVSDEALANPADVLVDTLDNHLSRQIDEILHHPTFLALESAWRGIFFLVNRIDYRQNIKTEILNCSKDDLFMDFEDAPEIAKSGLYKQTYSAEYGPFGGRPYAALLADFRLGPSAEDVELLYRCGATCLRSCMPFVAGAAAELVDTTSSKWEWFRTQEAARFTALVANRLLARRPYERPRSAVPFAYRETIGTQEDLPHHNGAYALGVAMARSFEFSRMASHITGPIGGVLHELHAFLGFHLDARFSERREQALVAGGFTPMSELSGGAGIVFGAAPTCLGAPDAFPAELAVEDQSVHRQVSTVLFIGRFVHYIKVLQREQIGTWKQLVDLRAELTDYLSQYVAPSGSKPGESADPSDPVEAALLGAIRGSRADDTALLVYADWLEERGRQEESDHIKMRASSRARGEAAPSGRYGTRGRYPLRSVELGLEDAGPAWFQLKLTISPNFSRGGRFFRIGVTNLLDKE